MQMDAELEGVANLDLGGRGVPPLAEAARARLGRSPVGAAADLLASLPPGLVVVLTTGIAPRPWISTSRIESDGPPGTAVLASVLLRGFDLRPVLVAEEEILPRLGGVFQAAGVTGRGVLRPFPVEASRARTAATALLDELQPAALVSIERLGRNERGVFHSAFGLDVSAGKAPIDDLFAVATQRRIPTIGVGDGGNEIGMGAIRDAVRAHVAFGAECQCGCGGGAAAMQATDVLVTGGTSNWAAYAIVAALAARLGRADLLHRPDEEERLLRTGVELGLINGLSGASDPDVDLIPLAAHRAIVELLAVIARRSIAG